MWAGGVHGTRFWEPQRNQGRPRRPPPSPGARGQWLRRARSPWRLNRWRAAGSLRSLKGTLLWVRTFHTVEELRLAPLAFEQTCNGPRLNERHGHRAPARFRREQIDNQALVARSQASVSEPRSDTSPCYEWEESCGLPER